VRARAPTTKNAFDKSPAPRANTLRQSLTTPRRSVNCFIGSRARVMRTRRLLARMNVFVSTCQRHGPSDIGMFVDDAPLKKACASRAISL
jgi:hypothetical protein